MSYMPKKKPLGEVMLTVSEYARKSVESAIEGARHFFDESGEIPPAITCVDENDDPHVYPAVHRNDVEKQCAWAFLRFLRETHPIVLLISEVWVSTCGKDEDLRDRPRPSQDPKRKELCMISLWDGKRSLWIAADITRNPNKLGEFTVRLDSNDEDCSVTGELAKGKTYNGKEQYGYGNRR